LPAQAVSSVHAWRLWVRKAQIGIYETMAIAWGYTYRKTTIFLLSTLLNGCKINLNHQFFFNKKKGKKSSSSSKTTTQQRHKHNSKNEE
jgi:hypothetical protein